MYIESQSFCELGGVGEIYKYSLIIKAKLKSFGKFENHSRLPIIIFWFKNVLINIPENTNTNRLSYTITVCEGKNNSLT